MIREKLREIGLSEHSRTGHHLRSRIAKRALQGFEYFHHTVSGVLYYPMATFVAHKIFAGQDLAHQIMMIYPVKQILWGSVSLALATVPESLTRRILVSVPNNLKESIRRELCGVNVVLPRCEYGVGHVAGEYHFEGRPIRQITFC
jgi:hypothetical protein